MSNVLRYFYARYVELVTRAPDAVTQIEDTARYATYMLPGRFGDSEEFSELIYAGVGLLSQVNDNILISEAKHTDKGKKIINLFKHLDEVELRVKRLLALISTVENFVELAAKKSPNRRVHLRTVLVIEVVKAFFRLLLLARRNGGLSTSPALPSVDRTLLIDAVKEAHAADAQEEEERKASPDSVLSHHPDFELYRRQLQEMNDGEVRGTSAHRLHNFHSTLNGGNITLPPTELSKLQMLGEVLWILRPLVILYSVSRNGRKSWKPWLLSAGIEVVSFWALHKGNRLNEGERHELHRRLMLWWFWLFRSPVYDNWTDEKIRGVLGFFGRWIPLASWVTEPALETLPIWQSLYTFTWSA
eukprot:Clim_evm6s199 gene=Clim_evmTU6s199